MIENPLVGASFQEWDAEMVRMGWIVDRNGRHCDHYCPTCSMPFAVMIAALGALEST